MVSEKTPQSSDSLLMVVFVLKGENLVLASSYPLSKQNTTVTISMCQQWEKELTRGVHWLQETRPLARQIGFESFGTNSFISLGYFVSSAQKGNRSK